MQAFRPLIAALALALAACSGVPQQPGGVSPAQQTPPVPAPPARPQAVALPQIDNLTPLPSLLLVGEDLAGRYYSMAAKATFSIEADGRLRLLEQDGAQAMEPMAPQSDMQDADMSTDCRPYGAVANQRTTWFPHTGVFVRGGSLLGARSAGQDITVRALTPHEGGRMLYVGKDADAMQIYYAPCVGPHRVAAGWQLDRYLPDAALLRVRSEGADGARVQDLRLPSPFAPFVLLRYASGAVVPVPMRTVLATVDLPARRVVLQLQSTYAVQPAIRKMELRLIVAGSQPSEGESAARHAERTQAQLRDLARCPPPRGQAVEPCANAGRRPDPLIFFASEKLSK